MVCPIQSNEVDVLIDYCSHKLEPGRASSLEHHLSGCSECRALVDAQRDLWDTLDTWEAEPVSADFDRRLHQRIELEGDGSWWTRLADRFRFLPARPMMPVAAGAAALLAAMLLRPLPPPAEVGSQARADQVDIEMVEKALEDMEMLEQLTGSKAENGSERL